MHHEKHEEQVLPDTEVLVQWRQHQFHYSSTPTLHQSEEILNCGSGFPRPPRLSESDGGQVAATMTAMPYERIEVECYSGYRANERPVAFSYQGRRWEVEEIIDRWYEGGVHPNQPALDYFKVRTTEGKVFLLRYNQLFDAWAIRIPPKTAH